MREQGCGRRVGLIAGDLVFLSCAALGLAALAQTAARLGQGLLPGYAPDVLHAHDWQTGLVPAYLRYSGKPGPKTVFTIHNLAYQGQFPRDLLSRLGLPDRAYAMDGVEYYDSIGYLKAGIQLADPLFKNDSPDPASIRRQNN